MAEEKLNENDKHWLGIINACYDSGLTVKQWCRDHKIANSTFYFQLKRLRNKACELPAYTVRNQAVSYHQDVVAIKVDDDLPIAQEKADSAYFNDTGSFNSAIRIFTESGLRLDISNNASAELISNTLLALRSC